METYIEKIPEWLTAVSSFGLFCVAWYQIRKLIRSNTIQLVLNLESELNSRKVRIDDVSSSLRHASNEGNMTKLEIIEDDLEAAIDGYLNVLDRLCFCILKDYMKDRDWQSEYRELLQDTIRNNEDKFGTGTYYKNIKTLYENWSKS